MRIALLLSAALAAASAAPALAQGGPMSVGIPSTPVDISVHCASAISAEMYLVEEEGRPPTFDTAKLGAAMEAWTKDAAAKKGLSLDAMTSDKGFLALTEDKAWKDDIRTAQVRWCLPRTPA